MASRLRITYNAPVVLTFALLALVGTLAPDSLKSWLVAAPGLGGPRTWVGLLTHVFGHASFSHYLGNFMLILLLGPILEERHGSVGLLAMIVVTALVTGLVNLVLSSHGLMGASGIVFMMILLASTANIRQGEIPLTFIAVAIVYLGGEVLSSFKDDGISHLAHLVGGASGAAIGFLRARRRAAPASPAKPAAP